MPFKNKKSQTTQEPEQKKQQYEYETIAYVKLFESPQNAKHSFRAEITFVEDDEVVKGFLYEPKKESKCALCGSIFRVVIHGRTEKLDFEDQIGSLFLYENGAGRGSHIFYGSFSLSGDWEDEKFDVTLWEGDKYGEADFSGSVRKKLEMKEAEPVSQSTTQKTSKKQTISSESTTPTRTSKSKEPPKQEEQTWSKKVLAKNKTRVRNQEMVPPPDLDDNILF